MTIQSLDQRGTGSEVVEEKAPNEKRISVTTAVSKTALYFCFCFGGIVIYLLGFKKEVIKLWVHQIQLTGFLFTLCSSVSRNNEEVGETEDM